MCDVPSIAVFCSESIECFPGTASKFFLKLIIIIIYILVRIILTYKQGNLAYNRKDLFTYLTLRRLMSYIYMEHPFLMFLDHTQRRSTVGRTPLDE